MQARTCEALSNALPNPSLTSHPRDAHQVVLRKTAPHGYSKKNVLGIEWSSLSNGRPPFQEALALRAGEHARCAAYWPDAHIRHSPRARRTATTAPNPAQQQRPLHTPRVAKVHSNPRLLSQSPTEKPRCTVTLRPTGSASRPHQGSRADRTRDREPTPSGIAQHDRPGSPLSPACCLVVALFSPGYRGFFDQSWGLFDRSPCCLTGKGCFFDRACVVF